MTAAPATMDGPPPAAYTAGAPTDEAIDWHSIDWDQAHRTVRRLQARIVQATQAGRWGKVRALQRLLTHSFSGKVLAVRRVTENQGKRTPGVDRITWETPAKKMAAVQELRQRGYRPQPLRRVYIAKSNGKLRGLGMPTMKDRAMQALYLLALDPIAEVTADPNSYGFRQERSPADAMQQCFVVLSHADSAQWVLEGDIRACFDAISHEWLEAHIPMDKAILHAWLKAGYMDKRVLHPTEQGAPQGGIASPVLANLALDGLERELRDHYPKTTRRGRAPKVNLVRFADDFIITGHSKEVLEGEVKPLVERFLGARGLELSTEKTVITHIADGFDFLGQNVRMYNGTLVIKPSHKSVKAFLDKVRTYVKAHKQMTAGHLIEYLNPLIRGWAFYHRHVASADTFASVDTAIFRTIWRWAKRRHPHKTTAWVKRKYFRAQEARDWIFYGEVAGAKGRTQQVWLFSAARVPIRRHVKVRSDANPYDPADEVYFEQRLGVKMERTLIGRRRLLRLWKEQDGLCPVCRHTITTLTGWHNHHLTWRSKGGSDREENRVLLHPTCHNRVHNHHISVVKPRPATGV
ncbi:MAG: group II intron reverse transcriptase/maturase [Chloroflexota bacterium]|nr:group II intron reverse transcriptase/maturase [Chloroflexota bacterium]